MLRLLLCLSLTTFFALTIGNARGEEPETITAQRYDVGIAKVDITPGYPVRLSGFGFRREESEGVLKPIYARALAISSETDAPLILITVDSTGLSQQLVDVVAQKLNPDGISPERIAVAATHTHTAPMVSGVLPTLFGQPIPPEHQKHIEQYTAELTAALVQAAREALKSREPSTLWWGTGELGFSKNRRAPAGGPVDHGLPVLVVKSLDGKVRAIHSSYACHAVTLSHNLIGGDWPGFATDSIERQHPGVVAMISIGCGADQNPIPGVVGDKVEVAESQGLEYAAAINKVLKNALRPVSGKLFAKVERYQLPLAELPSREYWEERVKIGKYIGYHAEVQLQTLDRGEQLPTAVDYSSQVWTFGDSLAMVFLPGEVVVDYAIRLRKEFDPERLWVTAYSNDCPCYIPSERILLEGGYEGASAMTYYNKPNIFAPGLENKIVESVARLLPLTFHRDQDKPHAGLPPHSPVQSLSRLNLPDDWTAQIVAAEPLTTDPVAFDFGPDRSLWVCEMHDYPSGLTGNFEPGGKVRLLRDDDGDGIYDRSTVFLDDLPFPTGVTVWHKGVLICAAPDILYAEDTDGDDKADVTRVLFTGFGTENYQARVNSLTFGMDGWVYGACGLFGGNIECKHTGEVVVLGNRDFRIDPDRGILEPLTGRSQQGRVRNDAGDWFGCSNGSVGWNYPVLTDQSRAGLSLPPFVISVPVENARQLFPASEDYQRFKLSGPAGQVTAACGIGIYRDDVLGLGLEGNTVTCEPVNLLLHRLQLKADGLTVRGYRSEEEKESELITSTDNWFRPVQVRTGPDGGLWVADMSRAVVEHPRWIPEEMLKNLDVRAGDKQGRIIRVIPRDGTLRDIPDLTQLSPQEMVAVLRSPNGTLRDLAQQMLLWNPDTAAIKPLNTLVDSDSAPASRTAALWVLARYDELSSDLLATMLTSTHADCRRQAWRVIAEHGEQFNDLEKLLQSGENETDLFVLREMIEAFRHHPELQNPNRLANLYSKHLNDRYLQFLILRAVSSQKWEAFTTAVLEQPDSTLTKLRPLLFISIAENSSPAMDALLTSFLARELTPGLMTTLEPVVEVAYRTPDSTPAWVTEATANQFQQIIQQARSWVADAEQPESIRVASAGLLGLVAKEKEQDLSLLLDHLRPQSSPLLQTKIIEVIGRSNPANMAEKLLERESSVAPTALTKIIELLLRRPETALTTLSAIENGKVSVHVVSPAQKQALLEHPRETVQQKAKVVFEDDTSSRQEVVKQFRGALSLTGNAERGLVVYQKKCSVCHQWEGAGHEVGPSLSESRNKTWEQLLNSLLDPNQALDHRYRVYVVATDDGQVMQGLLASENEDSITLKGQEAKLTTIPRSGIEELRRTDRSMMPEGFEKELKAQDFADLLALISGRTHQSNVITPEEVGKKLLDDSLSRETREEIVNSDAVPPGPLLQSMVAGLETANEEEAYRRIPWIWRIAIRAGKANQQENLVDLLDMSLPAVDDPLTDWQAVVIGGGIINGLSQSGVWPHERIAKLIGNNRDLRSRWNHALSEASSMTDNETVRSGTRYDALRMVAMTGWSQTNEQLVRYLHLTEHPELQMGAVSGIVDIPDPPATKALIDSLPNLTKRNRKLAIAGLMRSEHRMQALLESIEAGKTPPEFVDELALRILKESNSAKVRNLFNSVFVDSK